ncbi:MAG TPA: ABC transporter permease [Thermoanaerobaculia bacterium]|jgi:predicted permease|nr:ABC transporter permease [Thermoanaerobaculia bacterium]
MDVRNRLRRGFMTLFARSRREAELEAEIDFHLEAATARYRERGLSEKEARRAALLDFGGVDRAKEGMRDAWTFARLAEIGSDVKVAIHGFRKRPAYAATVIVTLALAIGAAGVIFNALWTVVARPLPYRDDQRLVRLEYTQLGSTDVLGLSPPELMDYRKATRSLEGLAEYHNMGFTLLGHGEPRQVRAGVVSSNYFGLHGVRPEIGRDFVAADDAANARPVLLLSNAFWRRELGGDPKIVGADFTMNDKVHTVIGILPPLPAAPDENDLFMPVSACPFRAAEQWAHSRTARGLVVTGRLATGFDLAAATAELDTLTQGLAKSYPEAYPKDVSLRPRLTTLRESLSAGARPTLWLLAAAAATVLFLVCANLLNLTLAQMVRREPEMAVRTSLGASRGRIARQLATEGCLLALLGGALGLLFGLACQGLLARFLGRLTPRASEIGFNLGTVAVVFGLALVIGLAIGLAPAMRKRTDLVTALRSDGPNSTSGGTPLRARDALIVIQVATSFVLLIGAGLLLRSLWNLERVPAGFAHSEVLTLGVPHNWTKLADDKTRLAYAERLLARVREVPGVESAALVDNYPLNSALPWNRRVAIGTVAPDPVSAGPSADFRTVSPNYFDTMGISLVAGRALNENDRDEEHPVTLINETFGRQLFPNESPLGRQVIFANGTTAWTIVGIVADVHQRTLNEPVVPEIYAPIAVRGGGADILLVRGPAIRTLVPSLRAAIRAIDPEQPIAVARTLAEARAESLAAPRATAALLAIAAVLALLIAAAGLAGLLAYSLGQREREFGIRQALGAERLDIARLVLGRTVSLVGLGALIGLGSSLLFTRGLSSMLFGLATTDPLTYGLVAAVLLGSAFAACLPALRQAVGTRPTLALRAS